MNTNSFVTYDYVSFLKGLNDYRSISEMTSNVAGKHYYVELFEIQETEQSRQRWAVMESHETKAVTVYLINDPREVVSFYETRRRYATHRLQVALERHM